MLEILKSLGLEESEAKLYLALLDLGESTVSHVTARAGITRTLGYHILRKLEALGLAKRVRSKSGGFTDSAKQIYRPEHPESLLALAEKRESETTKTARDLRLHLPDFLSLYSIDERFSLRTIHGLDACSVEYRNFYKSNSETFSIFDASSLDVFGAFDLWWNLHISRKGSHTEDKLLVVDNQPGRQWLASLEPEESRIAYKWLKQDTEENNSFKGQLLCAKDIVLALYKDEQELSLSSIKHAMIAGMFKNMFGFLWSLS